MTWTRKRQRDLWYTPTEIFPAENYVKAVGDWWRELQPPTRQSGLTHQFYFGGRVQPADVGEWNEVRKAGPNGLFLVIMAISWIPEAIASITPTSRTRAELLAALEVLLCDMEWVLDILCDLKPAEVIKPTGRQPKRKLDKGGQAIASNAPAKRTRKSIDVSKG
jgi:hypothetical protein